ncbi:MAG TPA: CHC2 zinc finger domain-containing protein [Pyrinomonadaceae bacterium]
MEQRGRRSAGLRELCKEVKARVEYRAFYARYCQEGRASGSQFHTHCPIPSHAHSGTGSPSLSVDLRRGLFHCFSRDEGGDAIRFYELMHGVSFGQAVRQMARDLGVGSPGRAPASLATRSAPDTDATAQEVLEPLPAERLSVVCEQFLKICRGEEQTEGVNYLARRGIDAGTMIRAGVAYFPRRAYRRVMRLMLKGFALEELQRSGLFNAQAHLTFYHHRLLFPFYQEGRAVYLQARTTASGVASRWHNMRGGVPSLYNVDALENLQSNSIVYLVEGFTDTLTLSAHGFAAVGLVGAGGFKEDWLAPLARFRIVAALDADTAGLRAASRYRELFAARGVSLAQLKLPTDVNDFFRQHPSAALELALLTEAALDDASNA